VTSKYFDLAIAGVIGLNVVTMAMEFYMMPDVRINQCLIYDFIDAQRFNIFVILAGIKLYSKSFQLLFYIRLYVGISI
jgi:voltage-dependent calcium channel T type alpha-1G